MSDSFNSNILVYTTADSNNQSLEVASRKLLILARKLTSGQVIAVGPASVSEDEYNRCGTDLFLAFEGLEKSNLHIGGVVADVIHSAIKNVKAEAVLLPSTVWGKQATAQLTALLQASGSVDISDLDIKDGKLLAGKSVLGGMWDTSFTLERRMGIVAVRTTGLNDETVDNPSSVKKESLAVELRPATAAIQVKSCQSNTGQVANLNEASIVVCGGRGTHGDFTPVRELATALEGAVGATRVACEEGWIDRSAQVGQSGISIAPNIYIGLGISGDQHHVCGIRGAKTVVAVCDDPQAEIFELCDFGVVGDISKVIPDALEKLAD